MPWQLAPVACFLRSLCAPYVPHRSALLRRLAEQKAHLLEGLCECVSARHGGRGGIVVNDVRKMGKQTAPSSLDGGRFQQRSGWPRTTKWGFSAEASTRPKPGPVSHLDQAADLRTLRHQRPGELVARSFPPVTGKDSSNLSLLVKPPVSPCRSILCPVQTKTTTESKALKYVASHNNPYPSPLNGILFFNPLAPGTFFVEQHVHLATKTQQSTDKPAITGWSSPAQSCAPRARPSDRAPSPHRHPRPSAPSDSASARAARGGRARPTAPSSSTRAGSSAPGRARSASRRCTSGMTPSHSFVAAQANAMAIQGSRHEGPPRKHRPLQINKVADANKDWQWALVLAGISDFARPAEKLSFTQNFALTCTGLIWTRWCLIIKPKNYLYAPPLSIMCQRPRLTDCLSLAAVNFFLGLVGIVQVSRIVMYESAKKKGLAEVVEDVKKDVKDQVKA